MPSRCQFRSSCRCLRLAGLAGAAVAATAILTAAESTAGIIADSPVVNLRISTFTKDGFRSWLLCGSEGRYLSQTQVEVKDLNLTAFSGDQAGKIDAILLSPVALADLAGEKARGPGPLRLISYTDNFEVFGEDWTYAQDRRQKKISLHKNVRVVFRAQLKPLF